MLKNYSVDNKITLSGTSQFTHRDSDPVGLLMMQKTQLADRLDQDPNTLVLGQEVWESLKGMFLLKV